MIEYGVWDISKAAFIDQGFYTKQEAARVIENMVEDADEPALRDVLLVRPVCPDHPGEPGEPDACQYGHGD